MVWDPKRIAPRSWAEVTAFFRNLEDRNAEFQPLRELVEHLGRQPYAATLEGATSGTALLVAPPGTADWATSAVRVDVGLSGAVQLTVAGKAPSTLPSAPGALVIAFERALRGAGWV